MKTYFSSFSIVEFNEFPFNSAPSAIFTENGDNFTVMLFFFLCVKCLLLLGDVSHLFLFLLLSECGWIHLWMENRHLCLFSWRFVDLQLLSQFLRETNASDEVVGDGCHVAEMKMLMMIAMLQRWRYWWWLWCCRDEDVDNDCYVPLITLKQELSKEASCFGSNFKLLLSTPPLLLMLLCFHV